MTGSRVLVQESVADAHRRRLSELVEAVKVGLADREDSQMGPLVDTANVERVEHFIAEASKYATVLVKGGRPSQPELANVPLLWRWKLQTGAALDLMPSMHWPAPVLRNEVGADRGPVLVTVEYQIRAADRGLFLDLNDWAANGGGTELSSGRSSRICRRRAASSKRSSWTPG